MNRRRGIGPNHSRLDAVEEWLFPRVMAFAFGFGVCALIDTIVRLP